MKKLINDPATVVTDALAGIAAAHPELRVDVERKIIYRADAPVPGKVGLISGGGSGTNRCTAASSASGCSTPPAPARCSRPRRPTRCTKPPSSSTEAPACCTSSRTTRATS